MEQRILLRIIRDVVYLRNIELHRELMRVIESNREYDWIDTYDYEIIG